MIGAVPFHLHETWFGRQHKSEQLLRASVQSKLKQVMLALPFFYLALIPMALVHSSSTSSDMQQVLNSVNGTRQQAGVQPICMSDAINQASLPQTQYQASTDTLTHDGTQDVGTRITTAGFSQAGAGECVGMSNPDSWTAVYQALLDDPAHYAILVNSSWTHMGWSKQSAPSGATYYTLDFAKASGNEPCSSGTGAAQTGPSQPSSTTAAAPMTTPKAAPNQFQGSPSRQGRRQRAGFYSQNMPFNQTVPSNMYGGDPNPSLTSSTHAG